MGNKIEIKQMDESYVQQIYQVHKKYYSHVTAEHIRWEFFDEKLVCPGIVVGAFDGEQLVGTQAFIPYKALSVDKEILSAKSELTLVEPDYRGQSIFERMYELGFELCEAAGVSAIWGFTGAIKPFIRIGFDITQTIWTEYVVWHPIALYRALKSGWKYDFDVERPVVSNIVPLDNQTSTEFSLVRDEDYLQHRYVRNPKRDIGFFDKEHGVVYSYGGERPQVLNISECVDLNTLQASIKALKRKFKGQWFGVKRFCTIPKLGWLTVPGSIYKRTHSAHMRVVFIWLGEHKGEPTPELNVDEGYTEGVR